MGPCRRAAGLAAILIWLAVLGAGDAAWADPGRCSEQGELLAVARSKAQLPRQVQAQLPKDVSFGTSMLAYPRGAFAGTAPVAIAVMVIPKPLGAKAAAAPGPAPASPAPAPAVPATPARAPAARLPGYSGCNGGWIIDAVIESCRPCTGMAPQRTLEPNDLLEPRTIKVFALPRLAGKVYFRANAASCPPCLAP